MQINTISFKEDKLKIIDQRKLPGEFSYLTLSSLDLVVNAIKNLSVRGAPAIGITAAYGLFIHAKALCQNGLLNLYSLEEAGKQLTNARPTAINLGWAVNRMLNVFKNNVNNSGLIILDALKNCAASIHEEDRKSCADIGRHGSAIIEDGWNILTHCNAGILATGGIGTALAPVYSAFEQKKSVHVFVDETRPVGQGARLTYWELQQNTIPATLITDSMAGSLMQQKRINLIIVGADRISKNGDVANKIGTYSLAVLANYHEIPFYVAAPLSTFDLSLEDGDNIPVEIRDQNEILSFWNISGQSKYKAFNPAFDITPASLITGIITESGIIRNPVENNLNNLFNH